MLYTAPFTLGGVRFSGFLALRLISILYVLLNFKEFRCFCKMFSKEMLLMLLIVGYSMFRSLLGDISLGVKDVSGLFTLVVMPFFLISLGRKIGIDSIERLVRYLLIATTFAVATSIVAFLVPPVHVFFRDVLIQIQEDDYLFENAFRGFGWGGGLTSEYAFVMAIMTVVGLIYNYKNKWFVLVVPFALIATLLNARTGFIIIIMGIIVYLIRSRRIGLSIAIIIIGIIVYSNISDIILLIFGEQENTYLWINGFIEYTNDYAHGDVSSGALSVLLSEMIWFPNNLVGWLLGEGISLFHGSQIYGYMMSSDIGFINQLFQGGLIYCALLYYLVLIICKRLKIRNQDILYLFVLLSFFIINFKGSFLFNTFSFGTIMLLYYGIYIFGSAQYKYPSHPIIS